MHQPFIVRCCFMLATTSLIFSWHESIKAADLNSAAISIQLPKEIKWIRSEASDRAILYGDPAKPGLYVLLLTWHPHHMSRPHYHPNDRIATVLKGTWWVGTGTKYQPENTVGVPEGSVVKHFGKEIHYDGAKDEDVTIEIVGMGPETATPAEEK